MTPSDSNYQLYSALSAEQRVDFFPFLIGFMGEDMDPSIFADAFVSFCQQPPGS